MKDPVMTTDGHSYERSEIAKWLKNKSTSPKTITIRLIQKIDPKDFKSFRKKKSTIKNSRILEF